MRILSVDDNLSNLYLVETIGRAHGHEVVSAHNGVEALERLAGGTFDLIISDILMPGMDGFQLCRTVKSDPQSKGIPFIFYTATYTSPQDEELGLALGASRFVIKPVEPDEFLAIIEQVTQEGVTGSIPVPDIDLNDGGKSLTLYNQRLIRKLEHKIEQLDAARKELSSALQEKEREILQRHKVEEALVRSEEQLRLTCDASKDGIVLRDWEGVVLRANQAFAQIVGAPLDELIGRPFQFMRDDGSVMTTGGVTPGEAGELQTDFEGRLQRRDGATVDVEGSNALVALPSGPAVVSVVRDVSARKRSEQERAELEEQLRQSQRLESVGRLAGGIAHDFNNLLTVINGYCDLLRNELEPGSGFLEAIDEINKAGQRAAALTRRLLGFTRRRPARLTPIDLNLVIQDATPMLTRLLGEDVELIANSHPQPLVVKADVLQLEQVLMNLVVNARDAMPKGGRLWIETAIHEPSDDGDSSTPSSLKRCAMLRVSDEGEGMTEETRRRLFEPFFTTKALEKGTGLGLSIVQSIVSQSEGRIEVQSATGQGATFRVYLPLQAEAATNPNAQGPSVDLNGHEIILVVEDQVDVRLFVTTALMHYGYKILQASGVSEACDTYDAADGRVDLLLTDMIMSDGNGEDLFARIKERWPDARVLFMSGYAHNATVAHALARGAGFIQKPFSPEQLAAKVRKALSEPPS